ncbi:GNAT family N-acetyltransferase [Aurantiacibacter spongiae]|uniref:N-acetyltransferase n=1 Tax=Aurantiacibacter spongiae TaxID=2488860 RepID=A0A3N5DC46_9SPHN|nr:N-acetyltransferase [Aurantiacibacter spongiae]RPF72358.1 N-acetyltransferase [Aurantiacibacter spongiae]
MTATIVPLADIDPALIEDLLDRAFGEGRQARTAYRVREGMNWLPALSFAALDEEDYLVGSIQVWPVALTDPRGRRHPLLMVGPVAVVPHLQGTGYGRALMAAMAGAIDPAAALPQVLVGDPEYYERFGFIAAPAAGWSLPGPYDQRRLLVRADNPAVLPEKGMIGPWLG